MAADLEQLMKNAKVMHARLPESAKLTFQSRTSLESGLQCRAVMREHSMVIDEPAGLGGDDAGPNPVEALLSALAACRIITYRFHAARLGIPLDGVEVLMEGDLDLRGFLAEEDSLRPGFQEIRGQVKLTTSASPEQVEKLEAAVNRYCPVRDNLATPTPMKMTLTVSGKEGLGQAEAAATAKA
jgi:putative redox protein